MLLPFPRDRGAARIHTQGGNPVYMDAFNAGGADIGNAQSKPISDVQVLEIVAPAIRRLVIRGGTGESVLIEICVRPSDGTTGKRGPGVAHA